MNYLIAAVGNYALELGVVDNIDQIWDSGMAFDGIPIGGVPIDDDDWHPGAHIAGPVEHRPGRPRRHAPPQDGLIDSSHQQKAFVLQSSRSCCTASSMPRLVVFYSLWSLKTDARIHQMVENAYKTTLACAFVSLVAGLYRKHALSVGNFYNRR